MTTELSKTQIEALKTGAAHDAGHITLPKTLRGGARQKVLSSLINGRLAAYRTGTLVITGEGMAAIGGVGTQSEQPIDQVPPEDEAVEQPSQVEVGPDAVTDVAPVALTDREPVTTEQSENAAPADGERPAKTPRSNTKQARLIEMLRRPEGATIDEIVKALDWQSHTVRGALAGALKKRLGLTIESEKVDTRGRVYRIAD